MNTNNLNIDKSNIAEVWIKSLPKNITVSSKSLLEKFIDQFISDFDSSKNLVVDDKLFESIPNDEVSILLQNGKDIFLDKLVFGKKVDKRILSKIYKIDKYFDEAKNNILGNNKDSEEEIEILKKKLEANRQYLQNILHYSDLAIMVVDSNEEFIAWNHGAEKIFGYKHDEIIGKKSSYLLPDGEKFKIEFQRMIDEVNNDGFSKIIETERKTKSNKIIPVQLNAAKLPGENNEITGRTVVITDVTEVRKLQQQVDQSEKLAVIGQLAAGVAHEIGNPLASISSIVQILQRKAKDQFTSDQLINVKDNINRISKIVRELVDLSRPPSHDEQITQISEVIKTAVGIVKYDKRVKKVEFKTDLNDNLPMVKIVPDQLLQVFINILINSLDAIEGEGVIKVKSNYDDKFIYVNLIDNGMGIAENDIEKIFDPFFTTKQVGKGTGLGLSVSYGIIKKFKGDITVKSIIGDGCDFQVKLPIQG